MWRLRRAKRNASSSALRSQYKRRFQVSKNYSHRINTFSHALEAPAPRLQQIWKSVSVYAVRTRVGRQLGSVDGQSHIVALFNRRSQMRTINLLQTGLQTILVDGGEGRSLQRQIQSILILLRGPHVENHTIEISTGHLDRGGLSVLTTRQWLAKIAQNLKILRVRFLAVIERTPPLQEQNAP